MKLSSLPIPNDRLNKVGIVRALPIGDQFDHSCTPSGYKYGVIESGAILLYSQTPEGKKYCLSLLGSGHIFTPDTMSAQCSSSGILRLEAIRPAHIRWLTAGEWHELVCIDSGLLHALVQQEATALNTIKFHTLQHHKRCSLAITRFALANYASVLGTPNECGSLTFKLKKRELADWLHVSVDRACRLINQLRDDGLVKVEGRSITISLSKLYDQL